MVTFEWDAMMGTPVEDVVASGGGGDATDMEVVAVGPIKVPVFMGDGCCGCCGGCIIIIMVVVVGCDIVRMAT